MRRPPWKAEVQKMQEQFWIGFRLAEGLTAGIATINQKNASMATEMYK